jgi:hypothetical protein
MNREDGLSPSGFARRITRPLALATIGILFAGLAVVAQSSGGAQRVTTTGRGGDLAPFARTATSPPDPLPAPAAVSAATDLAAAATTGTAAAVDNGAGAPPPVAAAPRPAPAPSVSDPAPATTANTNELVSAPTPAPVSVAAGVAQGSYTLHAVVAGTGARARLTAAGLRIAEFQVFDQHTVDVPVWVTGPDMPVGVESTDGGPIAVDELALAPAAPGFTTQGGTILDPLGRPFVPRGVNEWVYGLHSDGWGFSEADVAAMDAWGTNMVRLELGQQFAIPQMCRYDPAYLSRIDDAVRWITSRGMVVMLDLHWTTAGDPCGDVTLEPLADQLSIPFWLTVAARYKDNPLVVFDLFNEPHDVSASVWRDGGTMQGANHLIGGQQTWQAVGMQQLYDVVRSTGATNLIFASGTSWASEVNSHATTPLDAWGLVAGVHLYCNSCGGNLLADSDARVAGVRGELPVVVTEFGWNQDSGTYNANLIAWAEANGFGWLAYSWAAAPPQEFGLLANATTFQPSAQGIPVRDAMLRARSGG